MMMNRCLHSHVATQLDPVSLQVAVDLSEATVAVTETRQPCMLRMG